MDVDPNTISMFVNYAANVAADLTRYTAGRLSRALRKEPSEIASSRAALNISVQAELTSRGVSAHSAARIADYLLDAADISHQMLLVATGQNVSTYADLARLEIESHLRLEAQIPEADIQPAAEAIVLILGAVAVAQGRQGVHETPSHMRATSARQQQLGGQELFSQHQARLKFFEIIGRPSLSDIDAYTARYRDFAAKAYGAVQLQHLGEAASEVDLNRIHIPARFTTFSLDGWSYPEQYSAAELLAKSQRIVVLGPAGSGKSTTVRHSAALIAARLPQGPVPLLVELRKYASDHSNSPKLFVDFLKSRIADALQQEPPQGWLEYLLLTGRATVFFDGFDEVLSAVRRSEIRDSVREFGRLFPAVTIVVSSRVIGYDLAPLDESEYFHAHITEFSETQIQDYARKWFALRYKDDTKSARDSANTFVEESELHAEDLRKNPLMLSLLCSIYFLRGDIPRTLSEVYERCAGLMYQQWNTMRGIEDHHAWDGNMRPALYSVANLMISNETFMAEGMPREVLESALVRHFVQEGASDHIEAAKVARHTLDVWAGRAWILTSVSSDATQRPRYGFVHQSFLEYFAAIHIVRQVDTPAELHAALRERLIALNGWAIAQIAASTFNYWREKGGERYLIELVSDAKSSAHAERYALLRFAVSLLKLFSIGEIAEKNLISEVLDFLADVIDLPSGELSMESAHDQARDRSRAYRMSGQLDAFSDLEIVHFDANDYEPVEPIDLFDGRLSSLEAEVVVIQFISAAQGSPRLIELLGREIESRVVSSGADASSLAALFVFAIMRERYEVGSLGRRLAKISLSRVKRQHWSVAAALAALGIIRMSDIADYLPWHAFVLNEPLVLSYEVDLVTPSILDHDLKRLLERADGLKGLEHLGRAVARCSIRSSETYAIGRGLLSTALAFRPPRSSWQPAEVVQPWSSSVVLGVAAVMSLCATGWDSRQELEELAGPDQPEAFLSILNHLTGTQRVSPDLLSGVDGETALLVLELLNQAGPFSQRAVWKPGFALVEGE